MTFFLPENNASDAELLAQEIPNFAARMGASFRSTRISRDQLNFSEGFGTDLTDEIVGAVGGIDPKQSYKQVNSRQLARHGPRKVSDAERRRAAYEQMTAVRADDPSAFSEFPATEEEFQSFFDERLRAEYKEKQDLLQNAPAGSWGAETLGSLAADMSDEYAVTSLAGGLLIKSGIAGTIALEAGLGAAAEGMQSSAMAAPMAERLEIEPPSTGKDMLIAGATAGVLGGAAAAGGRYIQYRRSTKQTQSEIAASGADPIEAEGVILEAQKALENGRAPDPKRMPTRALDSVKIDYSLSGKTRDKPVSDDFLGRLRGVVAPLGDDIGVLITSGGQDAIGTPGGKRTGSTRHDVDHTGHSQTADLVLTRNGIPVRPNEDRELYARFFHGAAENFNGLGHYDWGVHVGGGSKAAWGPTKSASSLDPYFKEAIEAGRIGWTDWAPKTNGKKIGVPNEGIDLGPTSRGFTGQGQLRAGDDITIDVKYEVVDASLLKRASGDLQPRDRTRGSSDAWIADTAARLDPALLMPTTTADRGAPVVGADGIIESGNGRFAALERAYDRHPDRADAYRKEISNLGVEIPDGVERPVLIARRTSALSDTARRDFVVAAQDSGVARMTPTEIAQTSARAMTAERLSSFQPNAGLIDPENGGFVRTILSALPRSERNAMFDANGALNSEGVRRFEGAFYARAWSAPDLVARAVEQGDAGELKGLMTALQRSAPEWATLRAEIEAGQVAESFDITSSVTDAMRLIARAREGAGQGRGVSDMVSELLDEVDLLEGPVPPLTVRLVQRFYTDGRVASTDTVSAFLTGYAREARQVGKAGDMLGGTPRDVLAASDPLFADLPEDLGRPRGHVTPLEIAPIKEPVVIPEIEGLDVTAIRAEFEAEDLSRAFLTEKLDLPDGTKATVDDLLEDLAHDRALIDAVNTCYIEGGSA